MIIKPIICIRLSLKEIMKEEDYKEIQAKIQDDIEDGFNSINKLVPNADTSVVMIFYFLMFWSRVMARYGQHGELHSNKFLKEMINRMMSGDVPKDMDGFFDKRLH